MKIRRRKGFQCHAVAMLLLLAVGKSGGAQNPTPNPPPSAPPALNATVSDFGTSFVLTPPPVCAGCLETELGYQHLEDGNYAPAVVSFALPAGHTDLNALVNILDSEAPQSRRTTHFGNRFDFVVRQQVASKGGFELTLAPRGTVFVRGGDGGRAGTTVAPQYARGNNLTILNLTWTGAIGISAANPRSDYLTSFDYYRTLESHGTALFFGFQQEQTAGCDSAGIEEGLVLPFRNGQVELSSQQLDLNSGPEVQFQARVIVNWGRMLGRKTKYH